MKKLLILFGLILVTSCGGQKAPDTTEAERQMAEMMGITVEELRAQTPEEHMHMMMEMHKQNTGDIGEFLPGMQVAVASLPEVNPTQTIEVSHGDTIELNPTLIKKTIGEKSFAMYGYNGQIPGPIIKAKQGSSITVNVKNKMDMETTVHWHGLRHDNKDDGVPDLTQPAIEPDGEYSYTVRFPDEGVYWYHPHVREDIQQDMGLYGNLLVEPKEDLSAKVDAHEFLVLDDLLLGASGTPLPLGKDDASHALMGRFGNVFLVNGYPSPMERPEGMRTPPFMKVIPGTVVRFYITNVANTRTFRLSFGNAHIKRIGSDLGRYEKEEWVDEIIIAPAERYIVDVYFDQPNTTYPIVHRGSKQEYELAEITSNDGPETEWKSPELITHEDVVADIDRFRSEFNRPVDKTLRLTVDWEMAHKMHHDDTDGGIEWEDTMPAMNADSHKGNTQWKFIDEKTKKENMEIMWKFKVGDRVKIRIHNDDASDHPMHHPIHFHGQRFLVLSMDGKQNQNLVWKDTVLIPRGSTADLLFDISNPGDWMFHCHIAEHLTNGMMGMFHVSE